MRLYSPGPTTQIPPPRDPRHTSSHPRHSHCSPAAEALTSQPCIAASKVREVRVGLERQRITVQSSPDALECSSLRSSHGVFLGFRFPPKWHPRALYLKEPLTPAILYHIILAWFVVLKNTYFYSILPFTSHVSFLSVIILSGLLIAVSLAQRRVVLKLGDHWNHL